MYLSSFGTTLMQRTVVIRIETRFSAHPTC